MDLECYVLPARMSLHQCCTKVVIACREEFVPAGAHTVFHSRGFRATVFF